MQNKKVTCRKLHGGTEEVSVADLSFRPSVYGVAIKNNKVLLVPQWDGYDFPGGSIELGETIDEAFAREFREETGLTVERGEIIACESNFFIHPTNGKPYHCLLAYYLCKNIGGEISIQHFAEDERGYAKKAEWVDISRIESLKFYNPMDCVRIIQKALDENG